MPTIIWKRGDSFTCFGNGYGIVLDNKGNTLIVTKTSRSEYQIEKQAVVPADARSAEIRSMPFEIQMALRSSSVAIKIVDRALIEP